MKILAAVLMLCFYFSTTATAGADEPFSVPVTGAAVSSENGEQEETAQIADPLEPLNRVMFIINDKLYFWVMKPVANLYSFFVPEWGRVRVRNVFNNATMPVRFVNSVLQLKLDAAAVELGRFLANTTGGIGGMFDVAGTNPGAKSRDEDLGQTLGVYGVGNGLYIVWPVLGPSCLRDTVGMAGDFFLTPVNYITPSETSMAVSSFEMVNSTSLRIGDYEDFKEAAIDPYISMRDAYTQHRKKKISE